ncbi:MAG: preprotein translocase subunit SecG [Rhodocyclaceae bacterium]|jgi:preprotein translocase subunit SecG|nr:preprotein translocase subunit SecG [Rhodocyclaceae bacterium]
MDGMMFPLVLTLHIVVGLAVIGLVLIQHGKGADMGAAFGSGSSGSLFGASGSANFLSRTTAVLATIFFLTSLGLSYLATNSSKAPASVMEQVQTQPAAPAQKPEAAPQQPAGADSKAKDIPK